MRVHLPIALVSSLSLCAVLDACGDSKTPPAVIASPGSMPRATAASSPVGKRALERIAAKPSAPPGASPAEASQKPKTPAGGDEPLLSSVTELAPGGECPEVAADIIAAAAKAYVPLVVGLTLSNTWKAQQDDYEHECLEQVIDINQRAIVTHGSCPVGPDHTLRIWSRKICWSDLNKSSLYIPAASEKDPEVLGGSLKFSISSASLAELKSRQEVRHRFLQIAASDSKRLRFDIDGLLKSEGPGTFNVVVNGKPVEAPVIWASYIDQPKGYLIRTKILDDVRFPLLLDYYFPLDHYFITYTRISYPVANEVEQHLLVDKKADIYGLYFDFASDALRGESEPVLQEIATLMKTHPDWSLIINGHTDNVGDSNTNLELSRRRAAKVQEALVQRFKIDAARLSSSGFGASQPKEPNDTDRGRARNRRVELIRR